MKINNFATCLQIGKKWENEIEHWMDRYFSVDMPGWEVEISKDIHRDEDGDQFPDYVIYKTDLTKYCFLDAKKRNVYHHRGHPASFGFDIRFYKSYSNVSKKHNTKVFVAFRDPLFDRDNLYMLDLDSEPDFIWDYGNNGHGEPLCCRWYISSLKKMSIK